MRTCNIPTTFVLIIGCCASWTGCSDGWSRRAEYDLSPPQYCRYPAPLLAPDYGRLPADGDAESSSSSQTESEQAPDDPDSPGQSEAQVFNFDQEDPSLLGNQAQEPAGSCVDINEDGPDALTQLPGVGLRRAEQIIALRNTRPFTRLRHLRRVKGIGRKTVQKLAPMVCPL